MPNTKNHVPTIAEVAKQTGLNQNEVREVVELLQVYGVLEVLEPGDRLVAGVRSGLPTGMNPEDIVELDENEDWVEKEGAQG
ncbi:MAG: hypothetical protein GX030_02825 [Firmicutes bacterium]|nr:hypothetical protein [Bacillota bacterium]